MAEFADDARQVFAAAEEEGQRHGWLGTEHLLLALLRRPTGPVADILAGAGVGVAELRQEMDKVNATNATNLSPGRAPPTPHAKRAMVIAEQAASGGQVGLAHVLFAISDEDGPNFAQELLERRGFDLTEIRRRAS